MTTRLADLIQTRSEELGVPVTPPELLSAADRTWEAHKSEIDGLPTDFTYVLKTVLQQDRGRVQKRDYPNNTYIRVHLLPKYAEKFETWLEVVESKAKEDTRARYVTFRHAPALTYVRPLQGKSW